MSAPLVPADTDFCNCCDEDALRTPFAVFNRPGLSQLNFRVGTYGSFRQAMLEGIAREPRLAGLQTREAGDYAITLIELFAAVGDVLTFYNERIANELYLRTAVNRDSVVRLTRMLGYRANPGLAATTLLSFNLDSGAITKIRLGLKVMSTPGQDERALTFEALETLTADARLNALPVFAPPVAINPLGDGRTRAPILSRPDRLSRGDRLAFFVAHRLDLKEVVDVEVRPDGEHLHFAAIQGSFPPDAGFAAKVLRPLNLFAHDAPDSANYFDTNPATPVTQRWKSDTPIPAIGPNPASYALDRKLSDLKSGAQLLVDLGSGTPRYQTATVVQVSDAVARYFIGRAETVTFASLRETIVGRPKAVFIPGGAGFHMFARSGAGTVLALNSTNPAVPFEHLTGFTATEDPAGVSWGAGRVDLFVRNDIGETVQRTWTGAWGGWNDLGGIAASRPAPASDAAGSLWVFVRGLDLALWYRRFQAGVWGPWTPLGGIINSAPVPVASAPDQLDVFVRGADLGLWRRSFTLTGWTDWEALDGKLTSEPAAASCAPGRLDVVALDQDRMLIHRHWDGFKWTPWQSLDGPFADPPSILATGPDQVDVFVRKGDGGVRVLRRTGDAWAPAYTLEGSALSAISPAGGSGASTLLAARLADNSLGLRLWNGFAWGLWAAVGGAGLGPIADRRTTRLFELDPTPIRLRDYDYPDTTSGGVLAARLDAAGGLTGIDKGRQVRLDDGRRRQISQVTVTWVTPDFTDGPGHLMIGVDPPIGLPMNSVRLNGNIVKASHGELANPPDEPLGNGDAGKLFQQFQLRRSPLTYLPSAAGVKGAAELEIRVNGELWHETESFFGQGPKDRIYTLRQTEDAETLVSFGDGKTGARLPSGAMNVVARYRTGLGLAGNLKIDQINIPLERPVGLRGVSNPLAAEGAADPELVNDARRAAPTTVRTFGRAVSLEDFAWIATSSGLIARATATWVWRRLEKAIHLTVAAQGGAVLSDDGLKTLFDELAQVRDPNRPLMLGNLNRVPIVVAAKVMRSPDYLADDVLVNARTAILNLFAFEAMPLAAAVHESSIMAALQSAQGVVAVDLDVFHLKGFATLTAAELAVRSTTADPVQAHIRIYPARPTPSNPALIDRYAKQAFINGVAPEVLPAEQAWIEDPIADLFLTVTEAL
jgi:hypothetical protein